MRKEIKQLSLDQPATYQIKVPGELDPSWSSWVEGATMTVERKGEGPPVSVLTAWVDQAALHSLLRRLYGMGLPLISVVCVEWCRPRGPGDNPQENAKLGGNA